MPELKNDVLSWATDLDENTQRQAERTARLSVVHKPLALMPDAHLGMGATIGSVIGTDSAIVPAAVGVDIGCGMIAQKTTIAADDIDPVLQKLHDRIRAVVPAGQPRKGDRAAGSHSAPARSAALAELTRDTPSVDNNKFTQEKVAKQFGTLGGGNHFVEITIDEADTVWVVLHSGSRGSGNLIAQEHIGRAKRDMVKVLEDPLDDPDLAYFVEGTDEFAHYIDAMQWAQRYAFENRRLMMDNVLNEVDHLVSKGSVRGDDAINCHHNYAAKESRHVGHTQGGDQRGEGHDGSHPGLDGHGIVHRRRQGQPRLLHIGVARRRPQHVAHASSKGADGGVTEGAHGRDRMERRHQRPARRAPGGVQGSRHRDDQPGRPRRDQASPHNDSQLQGSLTWRSLPGRSPVSSRAVCD